MTGEEKLRKFASESFEKRITNVEDRVFHFLGYGHSNCVGILGNSSWILVDTLDSDKRAQRMYEELRKIKDVPVSTIIFTHGHPDHHGGSGAFKDMAPEVIAFTPCKTTLDYYNKINDFLTKRGRLQHGYGQTNEEAICQGIGPREGMTQNDGGYNFLDPTTIYTEDKVTRTIDGVNIELIRAPGETDDQIYVYLPDFKAICTGDNYYGVFPNLYAIRGTQYRDIAQWVSSLRSILDYDVEAMLPGHTAPIIGKENIINRVTAFAGAIEGVLMDTLECMNKGMTLSETVETVKLRPEYENCDFLGEFYGTVQWAVRSVYTGYVGWFDGSPSKLLPLSDREYTSELLSLIGEEKLEAKIDECLTNGNFQLALQLLDIKDNPEKRKSALLGRATEVTSANARHYLMGWAKFNLNL